MGGQDSSTDNTAGTGPDGRTAGGFTAPGRTFPPEPGGTATALTQPIATTTGAGALPCSLAPAFLTINLSGDSERDADLPKFRRRKGQPGPRPSAQTLEIVAAIRTGESQRSIAARFGLTQSRVCNISRKYVGLVSSEEHARRITASYVGRDRARQTGKIASGAFQIDRREDCLLVTTGGQTFTFDLGDEDLLRSRLWRINGTKRLVRQVSRGGKVLNLYIQHEILGVAPGVWIDHINGDPTNNRRANLRICTPTENARNRPPDRNSAVPYKGVSIAKNRFNASITADGVACRLGSHKTAEAAALAYDEAARRMFGEFAWINADHFPGLTQVQE